MFKTSYKGGFGPHSGSNGSQNATNLPDALRNNTAMGYKQ